MHLRAAISLLIVRAALAQCGPSAELYSELDALPYLNSDTATYREIIDAHRALLAKHPGDLHVEARLNMLVGIGWWAEQDRQIEIARYRAMSDRELGGFLEARLTSAAESSRLYPALAQRVNCDTLVHFARLRDPQTRDQEVREARKLIGGRTDEKALFAWETILPYLSEARDPELKEIVARLRALNLYDRETWHRAVMKGFDLLQDRDAAAELQAKWIERNPDSVWAIIAAEDAWKSQHPQPKTTDEAGFAEYTKDKIAFLRGLYERHPRAIRAAADYVNAAQYGNSPLLTTPQALAAAEVGLRSDRDYPFAVFRFDAVPLQVARAYLARNARLDEVPALVSEELRRKLNDFERALPNSNDAQNANYQLHRARLHGHAILAEYWVRKQDVAQARQNIELARTHLQALIPAENASANERKAFDYEQDRWANVARLAGLDATSQAEPRAIDWQKVQRVALPPFTATDLDGRKWDLAAWRGKVVFVNAWATWCVPCRAEMPNIQKLYDSLKDHAADRLVITVNIDGDDALTRKFLRDHNYTFPVIGGQQIPGLADARDGVPQTWIVDPEGRKLAEQVDIRCSTCAAKVAELMDRIATPRAK